MNKINRIWDILIWVLLFTTYLGCQGMRAQNWTPKVVHMISEHGWNYTQEEYDKHPPAAENIKYLWKNPDNTVGILNRQIKAAVSHYSDLQGIRIWDIQYKQGKWSRAWARDRKGRKRIRKIIKNK